jgi:hypothetical protein
MALDPQQQQQFAAWKAATALRQECPLCGVPNEWSPDDLVVTPVMRPGGVIVNGTLLPMVRVVCAHCGYVLHFAAPAMGIDLPRSAAHQDLKFC